MTPFLSAVAAGHTACAKLLLDSGANINSRDMHQRCCLHLAVENKKLDMLTMLLTETGNELVDVGDHLDRTPLHYATLADDVKVKKKRVIFNEESQRAQKVVYRRVLWKITKNKQKPNHRNRKKIHIYTEVKSRTKRIIKWLLTVHV